jgi:hypothetical protein
MKREYFYKNSKGEIVPYHYCSECGKRYTNEDFNDGLIINIGSNTTPIKYCVKPCLSLKFPEPEHQPSATIPLSKKFHPSNDDLPEKNLTIIKEIVADMEEEKIVKKKNTFNNINFEEELKKLSARQIVEKIKKEKKIELTDSLKSKKTIIRKALKLYAA